MAGSILTASAFNQLGQYTLSPDHRASCNAELAVSFFNGGRGQTELAWVAGYVARWLLEGCHLSHYKPMSLKQNNFVDLNHCVTVLLNRHR